MNKEQPLISVLMPAYNAEKYISESIDSILNQSYKNFEFIIIDDFSTDKTYEIIKKYSKQDSRIKCFKNSKNLGIAGNRNRLIKMAKGKYIVWQDADDISFSFRLAKQTSFMQTHKNVGICGSFIQSFDDKGFKDIRRYPFSDDSLRKNIFLYSPVAQPAAIIRKSVLNQVGLYNSKYPPAEDLDMSFRLGSCSKFANIQESLIYYREHLASNTYTRTKKQIQSTLEIRAKNRKNLSYQIRLIDYLAFIVTWMIQSLPTSFIISIFKISRNILLKINKK